MTMGADKLGKNKKNELKGKLSPGFENDVYDILNDLFWDEDSEIYIRSDNKYFNVAVKTFLEELNFTFNDSNLDEPVFVVSLKDGFFKFVEDTENVEDKIKLNIPYDWKEFEKTVRSYVKDNPIIKKEKVERNEEQWNSPREEQTDGDLIDNTIKGIKDTAKNLKRKMGGISNKDLGINIENWKEQLRHSFASVTYTAKGNTELKLKTGIYPHIVNLIKTSGWWEQFEEDYGSSPVTYMNKKVDKENLTTVLLTELGFGYLIEEGLIVISEGENWTYQKIEVRFEGIDKYEEEINEKSANMVDEVLAEIESEEKTEKTTTVTTPNGEVPTELVNMLVCGCHQKSLCDMAFSIDGADPIYIGFDGQKLRVTEKEIDDKIGDRIRKDMLLQKLSEKNIIDWVFDNRKEFKITGVCDISEGEVELSLNGETDLMKIFEMIFGIKSEEPSESTEESDKDTTSDGSIEIDEDK